MLEVRVVDESTGAMMDGREEGPEIIDTPFMGRIRTLGVGKDSIDDNGKILKDVFVRIYDLGGSGFLVYKVEEVRVKDILVRSGANRGLFTISNNTERWYGKHRIELASADDYMSRPVPDPSR